MLSLEEAITHCIEVAEQNEEQAKIYDGQAEALAYYSCKECAEEHRQLAEWLTELKECRKFYTCYNCYNASASFSDYPCCECRRCFKALDGIKDYYEEVKADDN